MFFVGFILYLITIAFFSMNEVNLKETKPFLFYGLTIMFWYPFIQLMIRRIKRLRGLFKK